MPAEISQPNHWTMVRSCIVPDAEFARRTEDWMKTIGIVGGMS